MKILFLMLCVCASVLMIDVKFEKLELEFYNEKYFNDFSFKMKRAGRKSPYILSLYFDLKIGLGNNVTMNFILHELIAGHHVLTPLQFTYKMCDALYKDVYFGKMFLEAFPEYWNCPFSVGIYNWTNIVMHFEYMPYVPFTYSSLIVRAHSTIDGHVGKELAFKFNVYSVITQKLQDKKS